MSVTTTTKDHLDGLLANYARFWLAPHTKGADYEALASELLGRNLAWMQEALDELGTAWRAADKKGKPVPYDIYTAYKAVCARHNAERGVDTQATITTTTCSACRGSGMCEVVRAGKGVSDLEYVHPGARTWPEGTRYVTLSSSVPCLCAQGQRVVERMNHKYPGFYSGAALRRLHDEGYVLLPLGAVTLAEKLGSWTGAPRVTITVTPAAPVAAPGAYPNASQAQPFTSLGGTLPAPAPAAVAPLLAAAEEPARLPEYVPAEGAEPDFDLADWVPGEAPSEEEPW